MDPKPPVTPDGEPSPHAPKELSQEELGYVFEEDEAMLVRYARLKRRLLISSLLSVGVVLVALFTMVSMFGDLRYWLFDDAEPEELALVDVLDGGKSLAPWLDHYVALSATPDASTAVKISLGRDGTVTEQLRFFRLLEAGNRVFVQTDLPVGESAKPELSIGGLDTKRLPGRFVGRVYRLGDLRFFESLRDHYNAAARPQFLDIVPAQWSKLAAPNLGRTLEVNTQEGTREVVLQEQDSFEVVTRAPEVMVQMGTKTWPNAADAIARVVSTGLPFIHLPYKATPLAGSKNPEMVVQGVQKQLMHRFLVRLEGKTPEALSQELEAGFEIPKDNASLEIGAAVLPRRRVYSASIDELRASQDALQFVPGSKTTSPGYDVVDGRLVQRAWDPKGLSVPFAQIDALRVKRPVMATRDSLIVLTDSPPSAQWASALAFGILTLFVLGNLYMARRFFKRYRELSAEDEIDLQASSAGPAGDGA